MDARDSGDSSFVGWRNHPCFPSLSRPTNKGYFENAILVYPPLHPSAPLFLLPLIVLAQDGSRSSRSLVVRQVGRFFEDGSEQGRGNRGVRVGERWSGSWYSLCQLAKAIVGTSMVFCFLTLWLASPGLRSLREDFRVPTKGELTDGRGVVQREPWSRLYDTTRWDVIDQAIP